ncbi:MAG: acyl-CoA/acyl-ACP dehydrogenase [Pseudomonadaceae bacterium]|nr:acyl-CoA/acyl-ACP dehydrogenase [Pseudomonadaceae bacterium]
MNFDFSEDEKLVADQVQRLLSDHCTTAHVRQVLEGDASMAKEAWSGLVDMGLPGTVVPESYGGVEAGYLTLCLVAQQLGAHVAPTPFSSSVYLATEALLQFADEAQKSTWLPKLAAGEVTGTLAVNETTDEVSQNNIDSIVADGHLSGRKLIVADGLTADIAVVLAVAKDGGPALYLADLRHESVERDAVETVDPTKASATITFDGVPVELIGGAGEGWQNLQRLYDRAAVLFAFEQIGGAQSALDMAVAYAQERFAFGRPIGSFQALKHMMADMYVALKLAESNCYYAAWALASDSADLPLAAATARVSATQAYQLCSRDNIQVHGGMGFTWEFDCHLYYRRSNYLALQLGGLAAWEDRLVDVLPLGDSPEAA